ncbi:OpgC family protein [Oceaniglobus trochenteri]|uniref:OpgC family protein n=1 Tax=Oceaniglobus trochenteri TaxID=2763260 RepID=UPI001CFF6770|nr:OpgC domain-containing protein [Oceaniglobus trochenteri]
MTTTIDFSSYTGASAPARPAKAVRVRDPRLDFYRGIAMFIILCAHTPSNYFSSWIPARWGFSDATEIFVFCSGMASAIAFGSSFDRRGWVLGTARVGQRVWQVYWAHIGMFMAIATMMAAIDHFGDYDKVYIGSLNLWKFFSDPAPQLIGLMSLTYVPNYFDILPMYMVILAMMPLVMALSRLGFWAVAVAVVAVWILAQGALWAWLDTGFAGLSLPAEPWSDRRWFFNPFAWQLVFFTGFALMRGWIPAPPVRWWIVALAAFVVLANVPLSHVGMREFGFDWAKDWRIANTGWIDKSDFALLRYVHFLGLAYLAYVVAGPGGARLQPEGESLPLRGWRVIVTLITKVGQQSLAVFLFSMAFARFSGFVMDQTERTAANMALANFVGFALLIAVAYGVAWFKSQPWRGSATG